MNVSKLRDFLRGLPDDTPIYFQTFNAEGDTFATLLIKIAVLRHDPDGLYVLLSDFTYADELQERVAR